MTAHHSYDTCPARSQVYTTHVYCSRVSSAQSPTCLLHALILAHTRTHVYVQTLARTPPRKHGEAYMHDTVGLSKQRHACMLDAVGIFKHCTLAMPNTTDPVRMRFCACTSVCACACVCLCESV